MVLFANAFVLAASASRTLWLRTMVHVQTIIHIPYMLHSVHVSRTTTWIRPTRSAYGGGESERDIRTSETPERREERLRVRRERDRARRAIRVANATADATQGPPAAVMCCPEGTTLCRKCRPETGPTAADKCYPDRTTCC